jgi:hypothetical protein
MKKRRVAHGRQPYGAKHRPSNEKWLYVQSIIGIGRVPALIEPIHLVVRRRMGSASMCAKSRPTSALQHALAEFGEYLEVI